MSERDTLKEVLQNSMDERGFNTSIGRLLEVDSIKNQPTIEYAQQDDHYRANVEIESAIDLAKKNPSITRIESVIERPLFVDKIRESIEIKELLDKYAHPTNAIRLQIEKDPSVR